MSMNWIISWFMLIICYTLVSNSMVKQSKNLYKLKELEIYSSILCGLITYFNYHVLYFSNTLRVMLTIFWIIFTILNIKALIDTIDLINNLKYILKEYLNSLPESQNKTKAIKEDFGKHLSEVILNTFDIEKFNQH